MSTYRVIVDQLVPGTSSRWSRKTLANVQAKDQQEAVEKALQMVKDREAKS